MRNPKQILPMIMVLVASVLLVVFFNNVPLSITGTSDLIAYYSMDNSTVNGSQIDDVHGSYNGTINGATTGANGLIVDSFSFDGNNDYVNLANFPETAQISFNIWFYQDSLIARNMFGAWSVSSPRYLVGTQADGTIAGWVTSDSWTTATGVYTAGSWNMLTITADDDTNVLKIYVNGVNKLNKSDYSQSFITDNALFFGYVNSGNYWNGDLDEFSIFDVVLSQSDIDDLYNSGAGLGYGDFTPATPSSSGDTNVTYQTQTEIPANSDSEKSIDDIDFFTVEEAEREYIRQEKVAQHEDRPALLRFVFHVTDSLFNLIKGVAN